MKEIFKETAELTGIPIHVVQKIIETYMYFVRTRLTKIHYRNLTTFKGIKTNFSIPGFGKLVVKNRSDKRLQNEKRFKEIKH